MPLCGVGVSVKCPTSPPPLTLGQPNSRGWRRALSRLLLPSGSGRSCLWRLCSFIGVESAYGVML